ncbi:phage integrase Arm DNA-binding domain-containing protein [Enterovibrio sp. Hal110]
MAARPRSHNIKVPNLYEKLDKRSGKVYYQYRDPRSGKFHGLGTERKRALAVAAELNNKISQQLLHHFQNILDDTQVKVKRSGISVGKWCQRYLQLMEERYKHGEISFYTKRNRAADTNILVTRCGTTGIAELDTKTLALIIDEYIAQGKRGMARRLTIPGAIFTKRLSTMARYLPDTIPRLPSEMFGSVRNEKG